MVSAADREKGALWRSVFFTGSLSSDLVSVACGDGIALSLTGKGQCFCQTGGAGCVASSICRWVAILRSCVGFLQRDRQKYLSSALQNHHTIVLKRTIKLHMMIAKFLLRNDHDGAHDCARVLQLLVTVFEVITAVPPDMK